jgi:ACR3 family arsenite efflux pump ArsB
MNIAFLHWTVWSIYYHWHWVVVNDALSTSVRTCRSHVLCNLLLYAVLPLLDIHVQTSSSEKNNDKKWYEDHMWTFMFLWSCLSYRIRTHNTLLTVMSYQWHVTIEHILCIQLYCIDTLAFSWQLLLVTLVDDWES